MKRLSWLVALLLALGVAAIPSPARAADGGFVWSGEPVAASQASGTPCADVLFLAARGSLEEGPYGDLVTQWRDELAAQTTGIPNRGTGSIREVYVDYPAAEPATMLEAGLDQLFFAEELPAVPYLDSVATGVVAATTALQDSRERCPDERWVLIGYSQGAHVMTEALAQLAGAAADKLLMAVLAGNPAHYEQQPVTEIAGDADPSATGLAAALSYIRHEAAAGRAEGGDDHATAAGVRAILELGQERAAVEAMVDAVGDDGLALDPSLADRVFSLCNKTDMVCDSGPAIHQIVVGSGNVDDFVAGSWDAHHAYLPDDARPVVGRAVAELRAIIPPPEAAPPSSQPQPPAAEAPLTPWLIMAGGVVVALLAGLAVALVMLVRRSRN